MRKLIWIPLLILIVACSRHDDNITLEPVKPAEPKPGRNIIHMIGDGMGLSQITGAKTVNGGKLNMFRCRTIGMQTTGAPLSGIAIAILLVLGGLVGTRRN